MPRPRFKPTDEHRRMVETTSGLGLTEVQIADVLNIDPKTLRKYFQREIKVGNVRAYTAVKQTFYQMATSGKNAAATTAWLNDFHRRPQNHLKQEQEKAANITHGVPVPEELHAELDKTITAELDSVAAAGAAASVRGQSEVGTEADSA
jgi:hypothetical protein